MPHSLPELFRESIVEQSHGRLNKVIIKSKLSNALKRLDHEWQSLGVTDSAIVAAASRELCMPQFILRIVQVLQDEAHNPGSLARDVLAEEGCELCDARSASQRKTAAACFDLVYRTVETVLSECLGAGPDAPHYERFATWLVQSVENDGHIRSAAAPRASFDGIRYVEELRWKLSQNPEDISAVLSLSRALFALACEQDTESKRQTLQSLKDLYKAYPAQADVALDYTNALVTLAFVQDVNQIEETIDELRRISAEFPRSVGIKEAYAYGLLYYATKQNTREGSGTVQLLRKTAEINLFNEDITAAYASALQILSEKQAPGDAAATLEILRRYVEKNAFNEDILMTYAHGLSRLHARRNDEGQELEKLRRFAEMYHQCHAVAICYVRAAVNAKSKHDLRGAAEVALDYCHRYPGDIQFIKAYMDALAGYSGLQSLEEAEKAISELEKAAHLNPLSMELQASLAKGLCQLAARQEPEDMELSVQQIHTLLGRNPGNAALVQYYALALSGLCACGDREVAPGALDKLSALYKRYKNLEKIRNSYAIGLHLLTVRADEPIAVRSLAELMRLVAKYPGDAALRNTYRCTIRGLLGQGARQEYDRLLGALMCMDTAYPNDNELRDERARLLGTLAEDIGCPVSQAALALLECEHNREPGNVTIALAYAGGLARRAESGGLAAESRFHKWAGRQTGNAAVACLYAGHVLSRSAGHLRHGQYMRIRKLYRDFPKSVELAALYMKAARMLPDRRLSALVTSVRTLRIVWGNFSDNNEFRLMYAESVCDLFSRQLSAHRYAEAEGSLDVMRRLANAAPCGDQTQTWHASMLVEMIQSRPLPEASKAAAELKAFSEQFADVTDVSVCFAQGLYHLSLLQAPGDALATLQIVRMVARQTPRHDGLSGLIRACEQRITELKSEANL